MNAKLGKKEKYFPNKTSLNTWGKAGVVLLVDAHLVVVTCTTSAVLVHKLYNRQLLHYTMRVDEAEAEGSLQVNLLKN